MANLVDGVTKISKIHFKPGREQAENFRKMILAMSQDIRVLIKLADRLHNMRTLQFRAPENQSLIAQETLDIYAPLADRLGIDWIKSELEDLSFRYLNPEEYQQPGQRGGLKKEEREKYIQEVQPIIPRNLTILRTEGQGQRPRQALLRHLPQDEGPEPGISTRSTMSSPSASSWIRSRPVMRCWGSSTPPGNRSRAVSKITSPCPRPTGTSPCTPPSSGPTANAWKCRFAPKRCTGWPMKALPPTGSTRRGKAIDPKDTQQFAWLRQLLEWQQELAGPPGIYGNRQGGPLSR